MECWDEVLDNDYNKNPANILRTLIEKRTGKEAECPRAKSEMTPCICRDGASAMAQDNKCIGCGADVFDLLKMEKK